MALLTVTAILVRQSAQWLAVLVVSVEPPRSLRLPCVDPLGRVRRQLRTASIRLNVMFSVSRMLSPSERPTVNRQNRLACSHGIRKETPMESTTCTVLCLRASNEPSTPWARHQSSAGPVCGQLDGHVPASRGLSGLTSGLSDCTSLKTAQMVHFGAIPPQIPDGCRWQPVGRRGCIAGAQPVHRPGTVCCTRFRLYQKMRSG